MSVRVGIGIGPFYVSAGGRSRRRRFLASHRVRHHPDRRQYPLWVWSLVFGVGEVAAIVLAAWWLLWATAAAILYEVARFRELPAWWGPAMDRTRPVWPKRKPAQAVSWNPKPIR